MSEWTYVIAAYALTWGVIIGYAVHLLMRKRTVSQRITSMEQQ